MRRKPRRRNAGRSAEAGSASPRRQRRPAKRALPRRSPRPEQREAPAKAAAARRQATRIFSSPLARRLAKEANVDLARVSGSGPHGRVIARDIEAAKSGKGLAAPAAAPAAGAAAPAMAPSMSDQQIRALYEEGSYEFVPHDGMRRTIAQRLTAAAQSMPVFYLTIDCDIGRLHGRARGDQCRRAERRGRQARLQALGQRLRHQGAGARLAAQPRNQCDLDRGRHAAAQAFRHRRRGGAAVRPDHPDRAQRRDEIALRHLQRDEATSPPARARRSSSRTNTRAARRRCPTSACTASRISPR